MGVTKRAECLKVGDSVKADDDFLGMNKTPLKKDQRVKISKITNGHVEVQGTRADQKAFSTWVHRDNADKLLAVCADGDAGSDGSALKPIRNAQSNHEKAPS